MAYDYYPGFTMYDRPDYKYLTTKKGCYPSEAFSILERGGSPIGKCGSDGIPYTSKNDLYNDPLFIISQQQTTTIFQKNPALLSPVITLPTPLPPITPPEIPVSGPNQEPPYVPPYVPPQPKTADEKEMYVSGIDPGFYPPPRRRLTRTEIVAQQTAIRRGKVIEAKHGFEGYVNKPTYFLAGESGREHIKITPSRNVRKKKGLYDFDLRGKWGGRSDIFIKDTGGF